MFAIAMILTSTGKIYVQQCNAFLSEVYHKLQSQSLIEWLYNVSKGNHQSIRAHSVLKLIETSNAIECHVRTRPYVLDFLVQFF